MCEGHASLRSELLLLTNLEVSNLYSTGVLKEATATVYSITATRRSR